MSRELSDDLMRQLDEASRRVEESLVDNDIYKELESKNAEMSSRRGRRVREHEEDGEIRSRRRVREPLDDEFPAFQSDFSEINLDAPNIKMDDIDLRIESPNRDTGSSEGKRDRNSLSGRRADIREDSRINLNDDSESVTRDFLDENEDREDRNNGPMSIDRPVQSRRRPVLDDDDDDYIPRKRNKVSEPSFLSNLKIQPKYIGIAVVVIAFFILGAFLDSKDGDSTNVEVLNDDTKTEYVESVEEEPEKVEEPVEYTYGGTTVERGDLLNNTVIEFSKDVYSDEIAISKFIEVRGGSFIPKFVGYSNILGREIEFQVSANDYNNYLNGVRINIKYRAVQMDGITYVTDIKIVQ